MPSDSTLSRYPGGKGLAFRDIINLMPPHDRYIETHLGSGAVFRNKLAAGSSIGIEIDPRIVARWRAVTPTPPIQIEQGDAVDLLSALELSSDDLVYCDPPYHPDTRRRLRCYRHDYDVGDHERLLATLVALPCMVVISGYRNALYDKALSHWWRTDYSTLTHQGQVIESAWTNFRTGPPLHDYRYAGSDFRERERIRRRASALADRIASAGEMELHAALAEIAALHPEALLAAAGRIEAPAAGREIRNEGPLARRSHALDNAAIRVDTPAWVRPHEQSPVPITDSGGSRRHGPGHAGGRTRATSRHTEGKEVRTAPTRIQGGPGPKRAHPRTRVQEKVVKP